MLPLHRFACWSLATATLAGCPSAESSKEANKAGADVVQAPPTAPKPGVSPSPSAPAEAPTSAVPEEPEAVPPTPGTSHRGPCSIRWSHGPKLTLKYTDEGGSVSLDQDGDGKKDACATFKHDDRGRPTYVRIDAACDNSFERTLRASYMRDANFATLKTTDGSGTTAETIEHSLVAMPSFSGLQPGFPIEVAKKHLQLEIRDKLVHSLVVKPKAIGVEPRSVKFSYDAQGRVSEIHDDLRNDKTIDAHYRYAYDDASNLVSIRVQDSTSERTASIDYACWK